jgi:hypothetical protein
MVSVEDLMKPRYKVIAKWPGMGAEPFCLGQIVTLNLHADDGWIYTPRHRIRDSYVKIGFFNNYPHQRVCSALQLYKEEDD